MLDKQEITNLGTLSQDMGLNTLVRTFLVTLMALRSLEKIVANSL
jgi:hypothetical protein